MSKFFFIMSHVATPDQIAAAHKDGHDVVELDAAGKKLLVVPDDAGLGRDWFVQRAEAVLAAVGGVRPGDTVHAMGQPQLANAVNAAVRRAGATLVESVTVRESVDEPQTDGTVKKTAVFRFRGYRTVYEF